MIEISNVSKTINRIPVLNNIQLDIKKGSIFGLIGQNGAGKTTLINAMVGIYKPDSGEIKMNGQNVWKNPLIKNIIGFVPETCHFNTQLKLSELLNIYKMTYHGFDAVKFNKMNIQLIGIPVEKKIRELSKGQKTTLALLINLCINPEILVLDEPTSGLDPVSRMQAIDLIIDHAAAKGTTIFISSHNLYDIEKVCDNVALIAKGEIKRNDSIDNIKSGIRKLQVVFKDSAPENLKNWPEILHIECTGRVYYLVTSSFKTELSKKLYQNGAQFIEMIDLNLEDIFINFVTGGRKSYEFN